MGGLHHPGGSASREGLHPGGEGLRESAYREGLHPGGLGRPPCSPKIHEILRHAVDKRAVRILLECFLAFQINIKGQLSATLACKGLFIPSFSVDA